MSSAEPTPNGPSLAEGPFLVVAQNIFGDRLPVAEAYADLLATDGVTRGLIGPREVPRLWERHMLNCAVLGELIASDTAVIDVGSGAGLPGIPLAIARPDLRLMLVEPMLRRTTFLEEAVAALKLDNVTVFRGRAEDCDVAAPVVTARAVADLGKLARWCLPLVVPGGELLAMKGSSAEEEITEHAKAVRKAGGGDATVVQCGVGVLEQPTTVVRVPRRR